MKQKNYNIPTVVYFVVTALLIAYFLPREGKFRYQFYEGKPWRYGLLTAPTTRYKRRKTAYSVSSSLITA